MTLREAMGEELREELREIAVEARVLLERAARRGRRRYVLAAPPAAPPLPVTKPPGAVLAGLRPAAEAPSGLSPGRGDPGRGHARAEAMTLPGLGLAPAGAGREDLPGDLASLGRVVSTCRKCGLCETRTQTVFADGSATAKLLFVGEAPGRDEDATGVPFVGRAGQLLDKMIAAIGLRRDEVYICNVIKCRPPENRTPMPGEVEQCLPYLEQQVALVKPALICALGLSAAQALLRSKASMASMRGRTFEYAGIPLVPTYHPAALLRNPGLKPEAWEDMKRVRDTLKALAAT